MLISKTIERDMWHRLPNHPSKCRNLHGHRYKAEVILEGDIIETRDSEQEGMVVDFSYIKEIAWWYINDILDHGYMFQTWDEIGILARNMGMKIIEVPFVPTAENVAKFLFEQLHSKFTQKYWESLKLHTIKLHETPTSYVVYPG